MYEVSGQQNDVGSRVWYLTLIIGCNLRNSYAQRAWKGFFNFMTVQHISKVGSYTFVAVREDTKCSSVTIVGQNSYNSVYQNKFFTKNVVKRFLG